ncbi:MAG: oligoendopeptidase F [Spirochaetales bacterium]|nr:oligoendopeptidase F [Spirochaetales bacterium]
MEAQKELKRDEIAEELKWDLALMYKSIDQWEEDFKRIQGYLDRLMLFKGTLKQGPARLKEFFELDDEFSRLIEKLYTFAHLRSDEDTSHSQNRGYYERILSMHHQCSAALSWARPEILEMDENQLQEYLKSPELSFYRFALEKMLRYKPYTLSEKEEKLLAMAAEVTSVPYKAFSMLNNADIKFPKISGEKGEEIQLSHGVYSQLLENHNRKLRKDAFEGMYSTFEAMKNTLTTTIDGAVKANIFNARARGYSSALEASLFKDNVTPKVYNSLIDSIHENLPIFHCYISLRKKALKLDQVDMYDMYVPMIPEYDLKVPWEQARTWVMEAFQPLGDEYCKVVKNAFTERWIDVKETKGKRSGAYSSGCFDSKPYMLLNYTETLNSVFTLAHEMGHSMHSYLSNSNQKYHYADYSIFVAEVASTTNELLLLDYLLKTQDDPQFRTYLLNHFCDGYKGTVYRQVQFAEFEKHIHEKAEKGEPLTLDSLNQDYYELNRKYYGPELENANDLIKLEWARIPHFYYNFYVYKYATGFTAAIVLSRNILSGDQKKTSHYLDFLKAGSSQYPLDILRHAGVDMEDPASVSGGLKYFDTQISELEKVLGI